MILSKFSFVCLIISGSVQFSLAQNYPTDFLNTHNEIRTEFGVGHMTWSQTIETYAQDYVNSQLSNCDQLIHSDGPYGENLAMSSGSFSGIDAIKLWVDEWVNYDYYSNSCTNGECLHFTQVVWANSVELRCARAECDNGWWYVSCNYSPPGNVTGVSPFNFKNKHIYNN